MIRPPSLLILILLIALVLGQGTRGVSLRAATPDHRAELSVVAATPGHYGTQSDEDGCAEDGCGQCGCPCCASSVMLPSSYAVYGPARDATAGPPCNKQGPRSLLVEQDPPIPRALT